MPEMISLQKLSCSNVAPFSNEEHNDAQGTVEPTFSLTVEESEFLFPKYIFPK